VAVLVLGLALTRDRQHVVVELDVDVLLGDAGEVGAQDIVGLGLDQIGGGQPATRRGPGRGRRVEQRVDQPVHRDRLPANKCHVKTSI